MRSEGPYRFELTGQPKLRFVGKIYGGMVCMIVDDSADDMTINSVPLWVDADFSERLERAVEAFNREMLCEMEPVKEAAE